MRGMPSAADCLTFLCRLYRFTFFLFVLSGCPRSHILQTIHRILLALPPCDLAATFSHDACARATHAARQVCFEPGVNTALSPCGHCFCWSCSQVSSCPKCMRAVTSRTRIYGPVQVLCDMQSRPLEGCSSPAASTMDCGSTWALPRDEEARGGVSASNRKGGEASLDEGGTLDEGFTTRLEALKEYTRRNGKASRDLVEQGLFARC